eukprot:11858949-Alexandrium_andersonii.AAC.1
MVPPALRAEGRHLGLSWGARRPAQGVQEAAGGRPKETTPNGLSEGRSGASGCFLRLSGELFRAPKKL